MVYDVIILGATFTAAGIASELKNQCLILERRPQAGYEFLNAVSFGKHYDQEPTTDSARELLAKMISRGLFAGDNICLFSSAPLLYQILEGKNVMLNMETVSVAQAEDLFTVTAHGVSGYRTFQARRVIDTRVHKNQIRSKSLNLLVNHDQGTTPLLPADIPTENWGFENDLTVKCAVQPEADYLEARKAVASMLRRLPDGCKAALVADCFDYSLTDDFPREDGGIVYIPSKQYANPILAFDAGVRYARGGNA